MTEAAARDGYIHRAEPGAPGGPLLFVFHGTGADETQFLGLGRDLLPEATVVAPRGDVSEHGAARYFRRTAEGVYDMDDLARATAKMAAFVAGRREAHAGAAVLGLGYSNGANILASVLFSHPGLFDAAVLMHPLIPFTPADAGSLAGTAVLVTAGRRDPICPQDLTESLVSTLRRRGAGADIFWHDGGHEIRQGEIVAAHAFLADRHARSRRRT
ncbi:MAG: esterase [Hyphomicrobiales bacterium]|nr:MAG: esterase [Hyphomicrobiales bacterium]